MYDELTGCYWEDVRVVKAQERELAKMSAMAIGMSILGLRIFNIFLGWFLSLRKNQKDLLQKFSENLLLRIVQNFPCKIYPTFQRLYFQSLFQIF